MKVAIVCESRVWGGLEVHAVGLARALVEAGHETAIVAIGSKTARNYQPRVPAGVSVVEVPEPRTRSIFEWSRAFRNVSADAVILEKGTLWTGGLALDAVLRWRYRNYVTVMQLEPPPIRRGSGRTPGSGWLRGVSLWRYRLRVSGFARSLFPRVTVCVSDAILRRLASDYWFPARRLTTIHNGVHPSDFAETPALRLRAREAWRVPADAFVFGSVGRLTNQKALDVAVRAFAEVVAERPDACLYLVLVGDGSERQGLEALAERLGIGSRVRLPGFSATPAAAYQGFDVFLISSRYEGLPFALVEALASGCVVVGTAVGGIPEVINDARLGRLVPPENAPALAAAMLDALTMPAEARTERRQLGRTRVREAFDFGAQCRRFTALLAGIRGSA